MARIRPGGTRQVRQPMGNPSIPDTGPVMVDISAAPPEKPNLIYGSSAHQAAPDQMRPAQVVSVDPPREPDPVIRSLPLDEGTDDAEVSLRKTRERVKSRREQQLEAENQTLRQYGTQQATEAAVAKHEKTKSDYDTVASALDMAESAASAAEQAYAEAWQKGDGLGVAKAQRAIADAQYRINTLRAGKDELEQAVRVAPQPAPPPPTAADANVELVLNRLRASPQNPNGLRPPEEDWIRQHPQAIDPGNELELRAAFLASQKRGLARGSPEYFEFLSERMGFDNDAGGDGEPEYEEEPVYQPPVRQEQRPRVAAPPSRGNNGGGLPPGKVMLTEAQRQVARLSMPGLSPERAEFEYAKGMVRLANDKKQGLYPSG